MQESLTPALALELLEEGNKRFVNNLKINRNLLQQANDTSDGQHPFAIIFTIRRMDAFVRRMDGMIC